jgi:glycosyltransferase involved in cell wall biosynthesis
MSTDYPADKIEWVVVEDAEKSEDMASDKIINFQVNYKKISVKYIPIQGRMTIGEKRNHGIEHATNDIILFMDDDDHYPPTSFRRRVAWLLKGRRGDKVGCDVAACTTIALYDLMRGVSAVNVPPWRLPLYQRISEATLTFRKSFWEERKFPHVNMAEGEEWLKGREEQFMEIAPQQIIVAFTHSGNASSRRVAPPDAQVSCFWGFPKEYLIFIHKLAGIEILEDKSDKKGGSKSSSKSSSKK